MPIKPKKIDFYVLEEVLSPFVGVFVFIVFTLLMFQALRLAEFLIVHEVPLLHIARILSYMILSFVPIAVPLAFLISLLIGFSRLSADSEIVSMKACGIGLFRLGSPMILFSILLCAGLMVANTRWVPQGEMALNRASLKVGNTKVVSAVKEGTFTSGFFDLLIFADKVDTARNRLHRVFIYDEREEKNPLAYVAQEAQIVPIRSETELGSSIMLKLYDGSMHHSSIDSHTYEKIDFQSYSLFLKVNEGSDSPFMKPQMILHSDLKNKIASTTTATYEGREYRGEYWKRYALALSPLVFVFLGLGFGTFRFRSAKAGAVLTGIGIVVLYWSIQVAGSSALGDGKIPPWLGMFLPNILLGLLGVHAFIRANW